MTAVVEARSLVAAEIPLPRPMPPVIGMGAFLKNTVTLIDGRRALVSRNVGHTDTPAAVAAMEDTARRLVDLAGVRPVAVAHDLHPDFPSTRFASVLAADLGAAAVPVQHHHAHVAAVALENGHDDPLLGLALDGFGLGPGNQAWGGECLYVDGGGYERLGHLAPLLQPGGDVAAREPWRMGAAALHALDRGGETASRWPGQPAAALLARVMDRGVNCPATSSAGRLFDAACGLLNVHPVAEFEGQAPMALERLATAPEVLADGWRTAADGVLDLRPLLSELADCTDAARGANLFHGTLAAALADWVAAAVERAPGPVSTIGFSGGCFYNKVMSADLEARLEGQGLTVLRPGRLGPGDPAVSLGQAWVASQLQTGG
ncbi:hydrogenase maturation protein HypF [Caenispirillum salinarum]|uniref:Kae1-like domain-containing protein n=1 Tax=Caenispirillum salinarum TaxID=859058 RepID=UPI00384BDCB1